jgi:DNA-binding NarL/FixJ family response regulator
MNIATSSADTQGYNHAQSLLQDPPVVLREPVRVFLVEDSPVIRNSLQDDLNLPGRIEVVGYSDTAAGALSYLGSHDCDVIVLDLDLKQGNGLQVLEGLRGISNDTHPLIIIFTNYVLPHYRTQSMQLGADYFFDKGRDFDRVREVIEGIAFAPDSGAPPVY